MMQILIVGHGEFPNALRNSAAMIVGKLKTEKIECVNITENMGMDQFSLRLKEIIDEHSGDEFLIFADLFGASPCNSCLSVFRDTNYRIITGANLPMLLELLTTNDDESLDVIWEKIINTGKESIRGVHIDI